MNKIRKGDEVIVIAERTRAFAVRSLSVSTRTIGCWSKASTWSSVTRRPNPNAGVQGGIVEQERPVHMSNVMLFNPVTGKGDRVGIRTLEDGTAGAVLQVEQRGRRRLSVDEAEGNGQAAGILQRDGRPAAERAAGYRERDGSATDHQDHLNMGVGEAVNDKKVIEQAVGDMTVISGQKAVITTESAEVGCRVQDSRRLPHRLQGHAAP